jgi:cytidine deaminase
MIEVKYGDLNFVQKNLLDHAYDAMKNSYSPYSKFSVGAALQIRNSKEIFTGVNVENASYGLVMCAERVAVGNAISNGYIDFSKVAIIAKGEEKDTTDTTGPCGACRQVLYEFYQVANNPLEIIMSTTNKDKIKIATIDEILNLAFGPKDLGVDVEKLKSNYK